MDFSGHKCSGCGLTYRAFRLPEGYSDAQIGAAVWAEIRDSRGSSRIAAGPQISAMQGRAKESFWREHLESCDPAISSAARIIENRRESLAAIRDGSDVLEAGEKKARCFLMRELSGGTRPAVEILGLMVSEGIPLRTCRRAVKSLGVKITRKGSSEGRGKGAWYWEV